MRANKYKEQIIMQELETFKKKGTIATGAVNDYVQSIEGKVRELITFNIQNHFVEKILQESCQTLDRVTIGLASMGPSPNVNGSRPIEDVPRPMITSDAVTVITTQWSSSDCSVPIDNERVSSSPSPDIVDESQEAMVEPSSSSASSTASTSRPPFKAKMLGILKQQKQRSSLDDEFAMEIPESSTIQDPEPSTKLNVDAPEFTPTDFTITSPKTSFPQTSSDNTAENSLQAQEQLQGHAEDRSGCLENLDREVPRLRSETESSVPKAMTSSSSMESFLTASATDSEHCREDEPTTSARDIKSVSGFEIGAGTSNGDNTQRLAPNCYPTGAESRPSSISTKNVLYDPEQVLRETAQALRKQAPNGFCEGADLRSLGLHERSDVHNTKHGLRDTAEDLQEQRGSSNDHQSGGQPSEWASKQTAPELARDMRQTRVPPLWTYIKVSFSDIDVDTGRIYIQMWADELSIVGLCEEMNASSKPLRMQDIVEGLFVIAPYQDKRYRASVISARSENDIEVFFIDYGNKASVTLQELSLIQNKKHTKTCRMAIPCQLADGLKVPNLLYDLPEHAYVCLGNSFEANGETVYSIMDVMCATAENLMELPEAMPFSPSDIFGTCPYSVVVTHATGPSSMWLVETKDLAVSQQIEDILRELPPEPCSPQFATKSTYVAYKGRRAMIIDCQDCRDSEGGQDGVLLELLLLESGKPEYKVPISECRRLPLMGHMIPRAAKVGRLANCRVPSDRPGLGESMMASIIGKTFEMKVKNDESEEVILVNPQTRKYVSKELEAKCGV